MATGPKGFEPLTTWLKARRSTELSYEPCYIKMYSIITMPKKYIKVHPVPTCGVTLIILTGELAGYLLQALFVDLYLLLEFPY